MPLPPAPALHIRLAVRRELTALIARATAPQRAVRRALVLLDAANGISNAEISRQRKIAREHVIAIRRRFEKHGIESVYRDAPGRGRPKQISEATVAKIITATMKSVPENATHCTADEMAQGFDVSSSTVYRLWRAHNLQPHRVDNFEFSTDPDLVSKLRDVVGLYMKPPTNAIVLSVDEKSSVQALERTAPILPLRNGIPARQTHDYRRNKTTMLFAALDTLTGKVIERCLPRHRHEEFLEFLQHIDCSVSRKLDIHLVMDNYATRKHADVTAWLEEHPRYHVNFTPTSSSWLKCCRTILCRNNKSQNPPRHLCQLRRTLTTTMRTLSRRLDKVRSHHHAKDQ